MVMISMELEIGLHYLMLIPQKIVVMKASSGIEPKYNFLCSVKIAFYNHICV